MGRLGLGQGRRRWVGLAVPPVVAPPAIAGFGRNGSANARLRSMLSRVRAGTGRGKIVMKGDSTTVGQGGGTGADPYRLTGARANRPAAVLAAGLTGAGISAVDGSVVADNGLGAFATVPLPAYDPRIALGSPAWTFAPDQSFAGGALMQCSSGGIASFTPAGTVDRFEIAYYNAQNALLEFAIDNGVSVIASGPTNVAITAGAGFGKVSFATTTAAAHFFQFACNSGAGGVAVASLTAYDSRTSAIDIKVDAALGATSANQAASGNGWRNLDHLAWEAPDLTIVNLGLNDMATGVSLATYVAGLRSIVTAARLSGDVLLVWPYPASPSFAAIATQTAFRDAAGALAQELNVAFLSLFDYFGGAFGSAYAARLVDGLVHGDAGLYADVGDAYRRCILAMAT